MTNEDYGMFLILVIAWLVSMIIAVGLSMFSGPLTMTVCLAAVVVMYYEMNPCIDREMELNKRRGRDG